MKRIRLALVATAAAAMLVACGGGGSGNQAPAVQYGKVVSFGDSLSDVGTYAVSGVAALGGGKYTVNSASAKNWTELLSAQLNVAAPCAAETGLTGTGIYNTSVSPPVLVLPLTAAATMHAGCYNYAQGGARVTNPVGPGNSALGGTNAVLGQLTVPVITQIQNHLTAVGGQFASDDLVTVMAGGNDFFMNIGAVAAYQQAHPTDAAGIAAAGQAAVTAMGQAGAELAAYINSLVVAKGAKRVVVANLFDVTTTPFASPYPDATKALMSLMVTTFNQYLTSGLATTQGVMLVDAYTASQQEAGSPSQYGLTDVTDTACNLTNTTLNPLSSSLTCTTNNTVAGDVSKYLFADTVHPTPYGYQLLAQLITSKMAARGWL